MRGAFERAGALRSAEEVVRRGLRAAGEVLAEGGMPRLEAQGKLIRPLVALAGASGFVDDRFWAAVAALQLAHEASLVHDDIIDAARERRGRPTVVASQGVTRALVAGDHLLTASYRAAALTGSLPFVAAFARAVERTVAGEVMQGSLTGERLDAEAQHAIIAGKSGELFACALATAKLLDGRGAAAEEELGRRIGIVYQRVDDLLDYLPHAATGKPALSDYRQRHWTWPLDLLPEVSFDLDPDDVAARFCRRPDQGEPPLGVAVSRMRSEIEELQSDLRMHFGEVAVLDAMLNEWRMAIDSAAQHRDSRDDRGRVRVEPADAAGWPPAPGDAASWMRAFSNGSRSFRFAATLFPPAERRRVAGIYTFCRYTDDLVDRAEGMAVEEIERRLDRWLALSRAAWEGHSTGVPLLDVVMPDAAAAGVSFQHIADLVEGMRMDLRPRCYPDLADLRVYTYRVASVVGLWLTESFGVRDESVLDRAATLGHAMQLTNILRDVGEDLEAGRLYLPLTMLEERGLDRSALEAMARRVPISDEYRDLIEALMTTAESWYRQAFTAIPALPLSFQLPVATAAHIYRGIHQGIRRNGHDNLRRRARTSGLDKLRLATTGLLALRRVRRAGMAVHLTASNSHASERAPVAEGSGR
jgi:15-cis-phytoene synthase